VNDIDLRTRVWRFKYSRNKRSRMMSNRDHRLTWGTMLWRDAGPKGKFKYRTFNSTRKLEDT